MDAPAASHCLQWLYNAIPSNTVPRVALPLEAAQLAKPTMPMCNQRERRHPGSPVATLAQTSSLLEVAQLALELVYLRRLFVELPLVLPNLVLHDAVVDAGAVGHRGVDGAVDG